jgi:hypothetical protein
MYGSFIFSSYFKLRFSECYKTAAAIEMSRTDGIRSFVLTGCPEMFVSVLTFIFNLSLFQGTFPNLWEQAAIVLVLN